MRLPPKVSLFLGQAIDNKIAVKDNLLRRGVSLEDVGLCSLCCTSLETSSHLFLSCTISWRL